MTNLLISNDIFLENSYFELVFLSSNVLNYSNDQIHSFTNDLVVYVIKKVKWGSALNSSVDTFIKKK